MRRGKSDGGDLTRNWRCRGFRKINQGRVERMNSRLEDLNSELRTKERGSMLQQESTSPGMVLEERND